MPEDKDQGAFEDRLNSIIGELSLGFQWEASSIILAVYRSEYIKNFVQSLMAQSLGKAGRWVVHYVVDKRHYDVPLELLERPDHQKVVFFVEGLRWGGGRGYSNAYRALNMHREFLVEGAVKVIFWMTVSEAKQITRFSPDFWAFRHRVVEFLELPSKKDSQPLGTSLVSYQSLYRNDAAELRSIINTARMFYSLGCMDEAISFYRKAIRKYPDAAAVHLQIAEIYLRLKRPVAAGRLLKKANRQRSLSAAFSAESVRLAQAIDAMKPVMGGFLEQPGLSQWNL
jgi:tetratricopeptide (TPR) repeat protein